MLRTVDTTFIDMLASGLSQGVLIVNSDLQVSYWNRWLEIQTGINKADILGKCLLSCFPEIKERGLDNKIIDCINKSTHYMLSSFFHDYLFVIKTNRHKKLVTMMQNVKIFPTMEFLPGNHAIILIEDITEQILHEKELIRINQILRGVRNVNQLITQVKSEGKLFKESCEILVKDIGYELVWLGLLDPESGSFISKASASKSVALFAEDPTLNQESLSLQPDALVSAVKTGQSQIIKELEADPVNWSWQDSTLQVGCKTACAIPLIQANQVFGVIAFFSSKYSAFDNEEVDLLEEISSDISFAVEHIRQREQEALLQLALNESEEKYRTIMESMPDAIYICSADYRVEYMNRNMIKRVGSGAVGEVCHRIIHGLNEKCPWCVYGRVVSGETVTSEILSPKDQKNYLVTSSPIYRKDGSISKLSIYRDVTEIKAIEVRLQQAHKMEAIGTLAGGIAHDFNNLLAVIIGFGELAKDDAPPGSKYRNDLDKVLVAGNRAKYLVRQILSFSRQTEVKLVPLSIKPLVKETMKMLRSSIPPTIEIVVDIGKDIGTVLSDPTQIHQVLMNLCTNANHAMLEKGGTLQVEIKNTLVDQANRQRLKLAGEHDTYVELMVSDTGTGIGPDVINKIFDPYFTTKGIGEGTGMGMAIVHGIIADHGGVITVKSELGKGTTFQVLIPVIGNDELLSCKQIEAIPTGNGQILFIDDEELLAEMGQDMLERLGYTVNAQTNSLEALEIFQQNPNQFDLVITDQTMPGMTGSDLAKRMLRIRPDIPIILCTGYSNLIDKSSAACLGIKEFALKPLSKGSLAKLVHKALNGGAS